jgi:hypothetical protein
MGSRIAHHIDFPDYTLDELMGIAELMLQRQRYHLSPTAQAAFRELLQGSMTAPGFANGRSVRNALERARLRHAGRLVSSGVAVGVDELVRIEADDVDTGLTLSRPQAPAMTP